VCSNLVVSNMYPDDDHDEYSHMQSCCHVVFVLFCIIRPMYMSLPLKECGRGFPIQEINGPKSLPNKSND
jgi:hypothetical protein